MTDGIMFCGSINISRPEKMEGHLPYLIMQRHSGAFSLAATYARQQDDSKGARGRACSAVCRVGVAATDAGTAELSVVETNTCSAPAIHENPRCVARVAQSCARVKLRISFSVETFNPMWTESHKERVALSQRPCMRLRGRGNETHRGQYRSCVPAWFEP